MTMSEGLIDLLTSPEKPEGPISETDVRYLHTAGAMQFDGRRLVLLGGENLVGWFSDLPQRQIGRLDARTFADFWEESAEMFESDMPSAVVTVTGHTPVVVRLLSLEVKGDQATYPLFQVQGQLPKEGGATSIIVEAGRSRLPSYSQMLA